MTIFSSVGALGQPVRGVGGARWLQGRGPRSAILRRHHLHTILALLLPLPVSACAATLEGRNQDNLDRIGNEIGGERDDERVHGPEVRFSGSLEDYVTYALKHSPRLRAAYDEWRAANYRISSARKLPEPTISYSFFVQTVETRVGPQRHRFSISQAFPWPTKLTAGADAASLAAASAGQRFEATGLTITRRVANAYWMLWQIQQTRKVLRDQLAIVNAMAGTARARVEVGRGAIADVAQIELSHSRLLDAMSGLDEQTRQMEAELITATGAPPTTRAPVDDVPPPLLVLAEDDDALRAAIAEHPQLEALDLMAESREELAESFDSDAYPSFKLGLTVIETGEAPMPNVPESGKDPVIVSIGLKLPIWQGVYGDKAQAARAEGSSFRAKRAVAQDEALGALSRVLSKIRDATRRVKLYQHTLIPQAEAVLGSVLAGYQTGETTVAATLLAEKELLELQLAIFRARAEQARAWARLEEIVGRAVLAKEVNLD